MQRLSNEGVNLEGIKRILALEKEVDRLRRRIVRLESRTTQPVRSSCGDRSAAPALTRH